MTLAFPTHTAYTAAVAIVAQDPIARDDWAALTKLATGGPYRVERSVALADLQRHRDALRADQVEQQNRQKYRRRQGLRRWNGQDSRSLPPSSHQTPKTRGQGA